MKPIYKKLEKAYEMLNEIREELENNLQDDENYDLYQMVSKVICDLEE